MGWEPSAWIAALLIAVGIFVSPYVQPPWLLAIVVILFSCLLVLIDKTRFIAIAIIVIAGLYGLEPGVFPLIVFTSTLAILCAGELAFRIFRRGELFSYTMYISGGAAGSFLVMLYLGQIEPLVILFGVVVAVLLKAILGERDDALMIEALGIAMTLTLIHDLDYRADLRLIAVADILSFGFGYFSYRFRTADLSGLFSGALMGIILIVFADIRWFLVMLSFFIIGSACTRYRFDFKEKLGVEQTHGGARGYRNVFANGIVSAASAVLFGMSGNPVFAVMFAGSVATAAADTVASEIGVTGGCPYMITTFRKVHPGVNGGVTFLGECCAIVSAAIIAITSLFLGVISGGAAIVIVIVAGFAGTNIDSLAGALLENRGIIGNAGTNVIGTLGGLLALALALMFA